MKYQCYLITNISSGKQYVGMTSHPYTQRFQDHFIEAAQEAKTGESSSILHLDMIAFGKQSFKVELLEDNISEEDHQDKERSWISKLHTYYVNGGYNMTFGGNGTVGYLFTDEVRAKMSEQRKGIKFSEERNEYLRKVMTGREYKQEWKDALSAARIGRFTKEDNPFYGKHHTEETKQKLRMNRYVGDVIQLDDKGNELNRFSGFLEAGNFIHDSGVSSAKGSTCGTRIREVARSNNPKCTAYGFHWKLIEERSID